MVLALANAMTMVKGIKERCFHRECLFLVKQTEILETSV